MTRGRPPKEFDKELFEQLCGIMCTEEEICGIFKTTDKTLSGWCERTYDLNFSEAYKIYSSRGKLSLRRAQFKLAQKSPAMAIFLGKNYLGQKDYFESDNKDALAKLDQILDGVKENAVKQTE